MSSRFKWTATALTAVVLVVVGIAGIAGIKVSAQQMCTTVLLCSGGSGGAGGRGGSGGIGGRGGVGGAGGAGGSRPAGGVVVAASLSLDKVSVSAGQTLTGTVSYGNTSNTPITLRSITIAARAPGATHNGGPFSDMTPAQTNITIPPSGTVKVTASRKFAATDAVGKWSAYSTYQDATGWHDAAPSSYFNVIGACSPETDGQFCSRQGKRCGTVSAVDNCGNTRLVQSCGLCLQGESCSANQCVGGTEDVGGGGGNGGTFPPPLGKMTIGTQEWFITGGANNWAGTNLYVSGVNWATAYSSGANIWSSQFLEDLKGFSTFRHMDTNAVNWSKITSWNQRKLPTDPGNADIYIDGSSPPNTTGMAVEWQIDLCNRANVDCWFTHPYLADDDYIRQQASLIKAKLNPGLRVYIELSNEAWNGTFAAFNQAIQAGQAGGLPGGNQYYQGIAHEMYRALQMYQIYQDVFGASLMGTRVIRVFSESGNLDLTTQALTSVYKSARWNPRGQKIDMMALAPYIGNGTDGARETLSRWKSEVDQKVSSEPIATALAQNRSAGIPLLGCYEGGMHHLQNANVFAANPIAYDAYTYMLNQFATKLNAPCNLYTLHGKWGTGGAWGIYNEVGQPLTTAHKARAAHDWIKNNLIRSGEGRHHHHHRRTRPY